MSVAPLADRRVQALGSDRGLLAKINVVSSTPPDDGIPMERFFILTVGGDFEPDAVIPEPGSLTLCALPAGVFAYYRWRRKKRIA